MLSRADHGCGLHKYMPNIKVFQARSDLLVNVNVQLVVGDEALTVPGTPDLNGQTRAHLGPDQGHLCAKAKLATGLLQTILCARQYAAQQVGYVLVRHSSTIVLYTDGDHVLQFLQGSTSKCNSQEQMHA